MVTAVAFNRPAFPLPRKGKVSVRRVVHHQKIRLVASCRPLSPGELTKRSSVIYFRARGKMSLRQNLRTPIPAAPATSPRYGFTYAKNRRSGERDSFSNYTHPF